jgi:hypothetical protein
MTLAHQSTTVSAATTSATAPVIAWPSSLAAGDLVIMTIGTKPVGTTTSGSSEGPLNVATLRANGWILAGTHHNGTTAASTDLGSTRVYVLLYIANGTETGNIAGIALTSADSTGVTCSRYTRDTSKEISYQIAFGSDTSSGTGWSITFGQNPGLKAGDKLFMVGVLPTDGAGGITWSAPSLTATGATFSQVAQRANVATTTGTDSGTRTAEWDVSTGPASAAPVWGQTLSGASTGSGAMLRLREVTPNGPSPDIIGEQVVNIPDATGSVASSAMTLLAGDDVVAICLNETGPATATITDNGGSTAVLQEDRSTGTAMPTGRMWTYEAATNETVTLTFDNAIAEHSRVYIWHTRGGTLTGMTKISVQDSTPSNPSASLPSVPTDALVIGALVDFSATSNTGSNLVWTTADDIIVDEDFWSSGEARWVAWHTWQPNTGTVQGPIAPTAMEACTFAIAIPPAATGKSAATQDSGAFGEATPGQKASTKTGVDSTATSDSPVGAKSFSKPSVDNPGPTDRVVSSKTPARAVADNLGLADRAQGGRSPVKSTVDSTTPSDAVVGRKTPVWVEVDSAAPGDVPAGRKNASAATSDQFGVIDRAQKPAPLAASGAAVDSLGIADRPTGAKSSVRTTADTAPPGDVAAGQKSFTRTAVDSTTPGDRPAGAKTPARAVVDTTTPGDRPVAGPKTASGSVADSIGTADRPAGAKARTVVTVDSPSFGDLASKGFASAQLTRDSASPQDAVAGRKNAAGATGTGMAPSGRPQGSRAAAQAATDATSPTARPAGRKGGVTVGTDAATPSSVLAGRKAGTRTTADTAVPAGRVLVRRNASGSTRSSTSIDEVIFRVVFYRDITVRGGRLRRDRIAGLLRPRLVGKLPRRPTGTAGGTAPEGDLREHA